MWCFAFTPPKKRNYFVPYWLLRLYKSCRDKTDPPRPLPQSRAEDDVPFPYADRPLPIQNARTSRGRVCEEACSSDNFEFVLNCKPHAITKEDFNECQKAYCDDLSNFIAAFD